MERNSCKAYLDELLVPLMPLVDAFDPAWSSVHHVGSMIFLERSGPARVMGAHWRAFSVAWTNPQYAESAHHTLQNDE